MNLRTLTIMVMTLIPRIALSASAPLPSSHVHPADQNPVALIASDDCQHTATELRCIKFLYNHDGDTLTVKVADVHPLLGEKISVRISGIDTPEMYSPDLCERKAAITAQRIVRQILLGAQRIDLHSVQRDKYFRILADVRADGESVGQKLLSYGLAYPYNGGTKAKINWCEVGDVFQ